MKCSLDVKLYPLYNYDLEFPVESTKYNDITIKFGNSFIINDIFCTYDYSYKFSLFEKKKEYLCSSNRIKLSWNLYDESGALDSLEISFLVDDTLQKDFSKIKLTNYLKKIYYFIIFTKKI